MSWMRRAAAVALCGIVLTLAALTFNAAPLFVPGVAFTLLGTVTPLWVWASAGCSPNGLSRASRSRG